MVLVTGGTGLIGSHLLFNLTKGNRKVRAIYRTEASKKKAKKVFSYYGEGSGEQFTCIEWIKADICDIPSLKNAFEQIDQVFHCAAMISFDPAQYQKLLKVNVEGTNNVVNLCLKENVKKLCYVSSIAALGNSFEKTIDEETEWNDLNTSVYGITKRSAELAVWRASQEGLPMTIVNPGVVLGPGFWKSGSGTFFYYAAKGKNKALPGGTGFISIHDVTHSMIKLMDSDVVNERFVLVDKNLSFLEIIQRIAQNMGVNAPKKTFSYATIELWWRLDWLRANLFGKRRRLTRNTAKSLRTRKEYSSKKIKNRLQIEFVGLDPIIAFCCSRFKEEYPELF